MTRTAAFHPEEAATSAAALHPLRDFAEKLGRELRLEDIRSGAWHARLVTAYVRHHEARQAATAAGARALRPSETDAIIRRACRDAALVGASAAGISTSATVFTMDTGLLGALVAVPVAGAAMGLDTMLRSLIQARMTCDVAAAFGVRIDPDDPWDFLHLHALTFGAARGGDAHGAELVNRMLTADTEEAERRLGNRLMGEGVLRNILPFVGVATSSVTSWRYTRRFGNAAVEYARYRRALDDAFSAVRSQDARCLELLIEGAWFLFNADGALRAEESVMLVHLLRSIPSVARTRVLERLVEDDNAWVERLHEVAEPARDAFMHALEVMAAVDMSTSSAEWQLLRQAASALGRPLRREHVQALVKQFRSHGIVPRVSEAGDRMRGERMHEPQDAGLRADAQVVPGAI
ncbi:hypothetical protein [Myxococcus sp. Y35]|uniref:hypothetical protein n=1 Tax=Pseudomyxococcus flavus TaxID=3115648 RepID=UPI003CEEF1DA